MSNDLKGILAVILAVGALSMGDAVIKGLSGAVSLWQILAIRSLLALPILIVALRFFRPQDRLYALKPGWVGLRSALLTLMWLVYYPALPFVDLSIAVAAYYTAPIFITVLSAIFLGTRISILAWFMAAIGFLGVVVMVRPDAEAFNPYVLLPVLAALLYAVAMLLTAAKCSEESAGVLSHWLNLFLIFAGLAGLGLIYLTDGQLIPENFGSFLTDGYIPVRLADLPIWLALATITVIGSVFAAIAYQLGRPHIVAGFDYSYLIFGVIWGYLFFAERPDGWALLGMAMILISGLSLLTLQRLSERVE